MYYHKRTFFFKVCNTHCSVCQHDKATNIVLFNVNKGDWFGAASASKYFWKRIKTDASEDHEGTASIGRRTITNLLCADDIGGLVGEEEELAKLVERLDKASTAYGIQISAEKTKMLTNNTSGITKEIKVIGQKLETVTSLKYKIAVCL